MYPSSVATNETSVGRARANIGEVTRYGYLGSPIARTRSKHESVVGVKRLDTASLGLAKDETIDNADARFAAELVLLFACQEGVVPARGETGVFEQPAESLD